MGIWELTDDGWRTLPDPNGVFDGAVFHQVISINDGYLAIGDGETEPDRLDAALMGDAVVMIGGHGDWNRAEPVVSTVRPG